MPDQLYSEDPCWVAPLELERRHFFSPHNPYFEHARWQAWLALEGGMPVGRISAQWDELRERRADTSRFGEFGCLAARDETALAPLLKQAEQWLREQGAQRACGPFSLSINQECGLLVEGFDTPPMLMMGHAASWMGEAVERAGYQPAVDLLAYRIRPDFEPPPAMQRLVERSGARLRVRSIDKQRFAQDIETLRELFNAAWADNWGFVPFTRAEFTELGRTLRLLVDPGFIQIAELDGRAAAMIVALPNVNEALQGLDGRLAPWGWAKLLWRLKVRHPASARVALMGVLPEYQSSRTGSALAFAVIDAVRWNLHRRGVRQVEMSWILETNRGMRGIIEAIGGQAYKRYRLYERELEGHRLRMTRCRSMPWSWPAAGPTIRLPPPTVSRARRSSRSRANRCCCGCCDLWSCPGWWAGQ